jgi:hypothetical protein
MSDKNITSKIEEVYRNFIIVSGLHRSGTSMMMQILEAAGLQCMYDNLIKPDEQNPNGYYEYHPVLSIRQNNSFLKEANGKVIKILCDKLEYLPLNYNYKIILMRRNMKEVISSQCYAFNFTNEELLSLNNDRYSKINRAESWLDKNKIPFFNCDYNNLLIDSKPILESLNKFLGLDLDINIMSKVIDKKLYRHRVE